ncbi:ATP-binding protein [Thermococcus chitonophagus]|uniref:ATP-binding protein n=1 Tax=Thermococcus chitonophagus TaxID=54262 RepID=UPI000A072286
MFFNRESEIEKITKIIENEPNMVNFVYGPINSRKLPSCWKLRISSQQIFQFST